MAPFGASRAGLMSVAADDIPDSAVAHGVASDYDGSQWVASIGPNIEDLNGDPSKESVTANEESFDVVRYNGSDDISQTTDLSISTGPSTAPQAFIYVARLRDIQDAFPRMIDGGEREWEHYHRDDGDNNEHNILSDSNNVTSSTSADTDLHVWCVEGTTNPTFRLIEDNASGTTLASDNVTWDSLTGITLGGRADNSSYAPVDIAEYTVLASHSTEERDGEISRLMDKYGI